MRGGDHIRVDTVEHERFTVGVSRDRDGILSDDLQEQHKEGKHK